VAPPIQPPPEGDDEIVNANSSDHHFPDLLEAGHQPAPPHPPEQDVVRRSQGGAPAPGPGLAVIQACTMAAVCTGALSQ
jgi:hypothetical protein